MKKTVEVLREMQYERLSITSETLALWRIANLPDTDLSSIVHALRQIAAMGRADTEDLHRLRTLTVEHFCILKHNFPSLLSEIEALGLIPYLHEVAYGPIPNCSIEYVEATDEK